MLLCLQTHAHSAPRARVAATGMALRLRTLLLLSIVLLACVARVTPVGAGEQRDREQQGSPSAAETTRMHEYTPPRPAEENRGYGPETVQNWAGYLTVYPQRHLWYWFFESRDKPESDPLVLWLTGGPGCSSLVALFAENGPYHICPNNLSLSLNAHSWNSRANIIFLDQPVGAGFSFSSSSSANASADHVDMGPLTQREIADNMHEFMQHFLRQYPKYAHLPFFVTGESYAGHFVPALAARILRANEEAPKDEQINLRGIAIGNGLVDALHQYGSYAPYARMHGLVSAEVEETMLALLPGCLDLIKRCSQLSAEGWQACLEAHVLCTYSQIVPAAADGSNPYDVRLQCGSSPLCYDFEHISRFLHQRHVRKALGVRHTGGEDGHAPCRWTECNMRVNQQLAMAGDWMLNFATDLPALLRAGVRVLVYAGDFDFVCNWLGQQEWLEAMPWEGQQAFSKARTHKWRVAGEVAGRVRSAKGLTFLRVHDAGHMVPMDQPEAALDMITRFMEGRPFEDGEVTHE